MELLKPLPIEVPACAPLVLAVLPQPGETELLLRTPEQLSSELTTRWPFSSWMTTDPSPEVAPLTALPPPVLDPAVAELPQPEPVVTVVPPPPELLVLTEDEAACAFSAGNVGARSASPATNGTDRIHMGHLRSDELILGAEWVERKAPDPPTPD